MGRLEGRAVGEDAGTEDIGFDVGALFGAGVPLGGTVGALEGRKVG